MSKRRILTVGLQLASADAESVAFGCKRSLLDSDIILFRPDISSFLEYCDWYQGKPSLTDSASFELKECCEHWRREIKQALETGKTVLVYLSSLQEVFIDTGRRTYSGTGRNQRTTRYVDVYQNYNAIPASLSAVTTAGDSMKLTVRGADALSPYWAEFGSRSKYEVILTDPKVPVCIVTRTGNKGVGALYRNKTSSGSLLLLPDIDFNSEEFVKENEGEPSWTPAANQFANCFISSIVALDKALRAGTEVTAEPTWATDPKFALGPESSLRIQILDAERKVEEAQKHKEELAEAIRSAGAFRRLLFEKGKPLENVVIESLRLLGFTAAPFRESDSEFDVVFESEEGRLIGEAEGKDDKAVNIDKLRQLTMNIHEDLQRDTVTTPAKPVLFGNGFRLLPLSERGNPFTEKCQSAASSTSTALVFTPDLFWAVKYLMTTPDANYSQACRKTLLISNGRVTFPPPPAVEQAKEDACQEDVAGK